MNRELAEVAGDPGVIVVIEWAEHAANVLGPRLRIILERLSQTKRQVAIEAVGSAYAGLVRELEQ